MSKDLYGGCSTQAETDSKEIKNVLIKFFLIEK